MVDLSWIAGGLSILALAGGAVGFFQSNRIKSIVDTQKLSIETLETSNRILQTTISGCKERLQAAEMTISVLQDQVTGTTAIAELTKLVIDQHRAVLKAIK